MSRALLVRIAAVTAIVLLALAVVLAALLAWLLGTTAGARQALRWADAAAPGMLGVASVRGRLAGTLELTGASWRQDSLALTIARVRLVWRPGALLGGAVAVDRLHADGVRLTLGPATPAEPDTGGLPPAVDLPFDILLRDLRVRDIEIGTPGAPQPLRLGEVGADTLMLVERLDVRRLSVRAPLGSLDLAGRLEPRGSYPLAVALRWRLHPTGGPELVGSGTVRGSLERLEIAQALAEPAPAHLSAVIEQPLSDPAFEATLDVPAFAPRRVDPAWPAGPLALRAEARGRPAAFAATGAAELELPAPGPLRAHFALRHAEGDWRLERLEVRDREGAERLVIEGEMRGAGPAAHLRLAGRWRDLAWPPAGAPMVASTRGRLAVEGTLAHYRLELAADLAPAWGPAGEWTARGRGDTTGLSIESLSGPLLGGRIEAQGEARWAPRPSWRLTLAGRDLDPAGIHPEWAGAVGFAARGEGSGSGERARLAFDLERLSGTLRGAPLAGAAALAVAGTRLEVPRLDLRWGEARLAGSATVAQQVAAELAFEAPALALVAPGWSGAGRLWLEARGTRRAPRLSMRAHVDSLASPGGSLARAELDAELDAAADGGLRAVVRAEGLASGGRRVERLGLEAEGPWEALGIRAAAVAGEDSLAMELAGAVRERAWRGELRGLDLHSARLGVWRLAHAAALEASATAFRLEDLGWGRDEARLEAAARWDAGAGWTAQGELRAMPLELIAGLLPPGLTLEGTLDGRLAAAAGPGGAVTGELQMRSSPGRVVLAPGTGEPVTVAFGHGEVRARADADGVEAHAALPIGADGSASGSLRLPGYRASGPPAPDQPLAGQLDLVLRDLAPFGGLVPGVVRARGRVDAHLTLAGTAGSPQLGGEARLTDGQADVRLAGVELRQVTLTVTGQGEGATVTGSVRSGEGRLALNGRFALAGEAGPAGTLTLSGRDLTAMNTREVKLRVDPDLTVRLEDGRVEVGGEVRVPEGEIDTGRTLEVGAIAASPDVELVGGARAAPAAPPVEVRGRVRVVLGDGIRLRAAGLDARATGSLLVLQEPGRPPAGTGELSLREGTYTAYGQDLAIERGRLLYAGGPLDDPGLDVRASRRADDGTVAGFEVGGTVQSPQLTLFSVPPMAERDALAYALTGRPLGASAGAGGDLVSQAAQSLPIAGGSAVARGIANQFGIQEAAIESEGAPREASVVLGTWLSPRLYIHYGIGLFEPQSTFRVRYRLGRHWLVEAERAEGSGADVVYSIGR